MRPKGFAGQLPGLVNLPPNGIGSRLHRVGLEVAGIQLVRPPD